MHQFVPEEHSKSSDLLFICVHFTNHVQQFMKTFNCKNFNFEYQAQCFFMYVVYLTFYYLAKKYMFKVSNNNNNKKPPQKGVNLVQN